MSQPRHGHPGRGGVTGPGAGPPPFRGAVAADVPGLVATEQAASLEALAHVFPPERYPYPTDEVRERWQRTLAEDGVRVLVHDAEGRDGAQHRIAALVAFDRHRLRHLAVHPDHQGRGLARAAVGHAVAEMSEPRLWCLAENTRALAFYARLGWTPTGRTRDAEFPPFPAEVELRLPAPGERPPTGEPP